MIKIETRERRAILTPEGGAVTFTLDAWAASIKTTIPCVVHPEVLHPGGYCKVVFAKGKQHIAIFQPLAPIGGVTDMGAAIIADETGKVVYQAVERGADYQLGTHHIPAFLFLASQPGESVKPGKVTVYQAPDGASYSIDHPAVKVWMSERQVGWGTVQTALWAIERGGYCVQDYHQARVIQSTVFSEASSAIWHFKEGGAPNPNRIPPIPYELRDIQEAYNTAWMRQQYRKCSRFGPPIIHVEGVQNVFEYPDGTIVKPNLVIHKDGREERPERLFVFDRVQNAWVDSPIRAAEIARQSARRNGGSGASDLQEMVSEPSSVITTGNH